MWRPSRYEVSLRSRQQKELLAVCSFHYSTDIRVLEEALKGFPLACAVHKVGWALGSRGARSECRPKSQELTYRRPPPKRKPCRVGDKVAAAVVRHLEALKVLLQHLYGKLHSGPGLVPVCRPAELHSVDSPRAVQNWVVVAGAEKVSSGATSSPADLPAVQVHQPVPVVAQSLQHLLCCPRRQIVLLPLVVTPQVTLARMHGLGGCELGAANSRSGPSNEGQSV